MTGNATRGEDGGGEGGREARVPRRISGKQLRVLVVISVVAVIVVVLLWGMVPERIYEVREVLDEIDDLDGQRINVKGVVLTWEAGLSNYTLADSDDGNITIEAVHVGSFPDGFGMDETVVAHGVVDRGGGAVRLTSDEIQIGCPSKY